MQDIIPDLERWREREQPIALATVVETWGSAPRAAGAKMAMTPDGDISGSVSGGCVEGAVYDTGLQVLQTGRPALLHFGVADENAWEVGLACGGNIDIFVQPIDFPSYEALKEALRLEQLIARVTVIRGAEGVVGRELVVYPDGRAVGSLSSDLNKQAREIAISEMERISTRPRAVRVNTSQVGAASEVEILVEIYPPPPVLIIVGGVHIAVVLVELANALGFRTVVIDPRRSFGNENRFPHTNQLFTTWPQEAFQQIKITPATAITMLTHDPKIDDPALRVALTSEAFYIGALGSPRTQEKRRQRLRDSGMDEEVIRRIHGPIGLELGGRTPEEIALAIMAQIVAARNQALGPEGRLQQSFN
jgi:xanthine dehydrogenase accessory factor